MRLEPGGMTTAAASTGPERQATPAASQPTTMRRPSRQWVLSMRVVGSITSPTIMPPGRCPWRRPSAAGTSLPKGCGLADAVAQEVELRPTGDAMSHHFDLLDPGCVDHEGALHADTAGDATDSDLTVNSASAQAHHRALEHLDPFAIALDDLHADAHRVA